MGLWWGPSLVRACQIQFKNKGKPPVDFWYIISHLALAPFWKIGLISTEKYYQSWGKDSAEMIKGIKVDRAREIFDWLFDHHFSPTLKKNVLERLKNIRKKVF